jgi:hypothetical protein
MEVSYLALVGSRGSIALSGFTIYDPLRANTKLLLTAAQLEAALNEGLRGLDLNYPLRTRSKVLKSKICQILGYPVPKSFKKTKPRFIGQDFDTYIQKSNNLQIWNEEIAPTRRYVIIRVDESSKVVRVRVVTGEVIAKLDPTGTLTKKYQARSREPIVQSVLVSPSDSYSVSQIIASLPNDGQVRVSEAAGSHIVNFNRFIPVVTTDLSPPAATKLQRRYYRKGRFGFIRAGLLLCCTRGGGAVSSCESSAGRGGVSNAARRAVAPYRELTVTRPVRTSTLHRLAGAGLTFADAELAQDIFHQTPLGDGRLQQVRADKHGEPQPVRVYPMRQGKAD